VGVCVSVGVGVGVGVGCCRHAYINLSYTHRSSPFVQAWHHSCRFRFVRSLPGCHCTSSASFSHLSHTCVPSSVRLMMPRRFLIPDPIPPRAPLASGDIVDVPCLLPGHRHPRRPLHRRSGHPLGDPTLAADPGALRGVEIPDLVLGDSSAPPGEEMPDLVVGARLSDILDEGLRGVRLRGDAGAPPRETEADMCGCAVGLAEAGSRGRGALAAGDSNTRVSSHPFTWPKCHEAAPSTPRGVTVDEHT